MVGFAVELDELDLETAAYVDEDLFHSFELVCGEDPVPVLGDENEVGVQREYAVSACRVVGVPELRAGGGYVWCGCKVPHVPNASTVRGAVGVVR